MPRPAAVLAFSLALLAVAPSTVGAITVPGSIHGAGTASYYWIVTGGPTIKGGAFDREFLCYGCFVRFTLTAGTVQVAQDGSPVPLAPGSYEIASFVGLLGITPRGPHDFFLELHGEGRVEPWAPPNAQ